MWMVLDLNRTRVIVDLNWRLIKGQVTRLEERIGLEIIYVIVLATVIRPIINANQIIPFP